MADFTPGPLTFEWEKYSGEDWLVCIADFGADGKAYITTDRVPASQARLGNPQADVALWTAARDLYEALEALTSQQEEPVEGCDCGRCEAIWQADAALHKARGEAQP